MKSIFANFGLAKFYNRRNHNDHLRAPWEDRCAATEAALKGEEELMKDLDTLARGTCWNQRLG